MVTVSVGCALAAVSVALAGDTTVDVGGRVVDLLVDRTVSAGQHRIVWRDRGLPSGVYFVRLEAGGAVRTGTMVLVK